MTNANETTHRHTSLIALFLAIIFFLASYIYTPFDKTFSVEVQSNNQKMSAYF